MSPKKLPILFKLYYANISLLGISFCLLQSYQLLLLVLSTKFRFKFRWRKRHIFLKAYPKRIYLRYLTTKKQKSKKIQKLAKKSLFGLKLYWKAYGFPIVKPTRILNTFKTLTLQQFYAHKLCNKNYYSLPFKIKQRIFLSPFLQRLRYARKFFKSKRSLRYKLFSNYILSKHNSKTIKNFLNLNSLRLGFFKEKNPKGFFFKFNTNFLKILRLARQTHWQLVPKKKLKNWRYTKFLNQEFRHKKKKNYYSNPLAYILFAMRICLSWKHTVFLLKFQLILVNGIRTFNKSKLLPGTIIQYPKLKFIKRLRRFWVRIYKKRIYQQKRRRYKYTCSKKRVWATRQRHLYKRIDFNRAQFHKIPLMLHYDRFTNSICILWFRQNIKFNPSTGTFKNTLIKLHTWRMVP